MAQRFINTVCFVRTYDYYGAYQPENLPTLQSHMALYNRLGLPATYLLEYDALEREEFRATVLKDRKPEDEIGLWFEITGGLCAAAGVPWRSKRDRDWDFHVDPGFIMAYDSEEKEKLCATAMEKFHEWFGFYPRTVGAWLLDSECMDYFNTHYGMDAYIICREQWGMDGYTPWGGPYFGGYYPSRNNMLTPAQSPENQLDVPVFRMFVSDPMYSYYEFSHGELNGIPYHLFTQEPTWRYGQDPQWVAWCMETLFGADTEGFSYYQLGQETSFGFGPELERAITMQCSYALSQQEKYGYEFLTVSNMGKRFKESYAATPVNFTPCAYDWAELGNQSVWYNSARYRVNLFVHEKELRIRDIHLFDDLHTDRYRNSPCRKHWAIYDNLPVVDGVRFTEGCDDRDIPSNSGFEGRRYGDAAGLYLNDPCRITGICRHDDAFCLRVNHGEYVITLREDSIEICRDMYRQFQMRFVHKKQLPYLTKTEEKKLSFQHLGCHYSLELESGCISGDYLLSENSKIIIKFGKVTH